MLALTLAIVLILVSILLRMRNRETFLIPLANNQVIPQTNPSDQVWDRHDIQDSYDMDDPMQYPNAYYNELPNREFQDALQKTFREEMILPNGAQWTPEILVDKDHIPPEPVIAGYKLLVPWVEKRLRASPHFRMPGDGSDPAPFQIIHDHWNAWSKSTLHPNRYMYHVEMLVFREAKYHAKHVSLRMVTEGTTVLGILEIRIMGIVFEDHFGLFPVTHSDKMDLEQPQLPVPMDPLVSYPSLMDDATIQAELDRRAKDLARVEKIKKLYEVHT